MLDAILCSDLEPIDVEPAMALLVGGVIVRAGFQSPRPTEVLEPQHPVPLTFRSLWYLGCFSRLT